MSRASYLGAVVATIFVAACGAALLVGAKALYPDPTTNLNSTDLADSDLCFLLGALSLGIGVPLVGWFGLSRTIAARAGAASWIADPVSSLAIAGCGGLALMGIGYFVLSQYLFPGSSFPPSCGVLSTLPVALPAPCAAGESIFEVGLLCTVLLIPAAVAFAFRRLWRERPLS